MVSTLSHAASSPASSSFKASTSVRRVLRRSCPRGRRSCFGNLIKPDCRTPSRSPITEATTPRHFSRPFAVFRCRVHDGDAAVTDVEPVDGNCVAFTPHYKRHVSILHAGEDCRDLSLSGDERRDVLIGNGHCLDAVASSFEARHRLSKARRELRGVEALVFPAAHDKRDGCCAQSNASSEGHRSRLRRLSCFSSKALSHASGYPGAMCQEVRVSHSRVPSLKGNGTDSVGRRPSGGLVPVLDSPPDGFTIQPARYKAPRHPVTRIRWLRKAKRLRLR